MTALVCEIAKPGTESPMCSPVTLASVIALSDEVRKRLHRGPVVSPKMNETPEESYDIMKAVEVKTHRNKPRSVALADFAKTKSRDEMLLT